MSEENTGYLSSEQLLFLSPWKPVETDTSWLEGQPWNCPNCSGERSYFRSLARLEGAPNQFMVQCPTCDHLVVVETGSDGRPEIHTRYGGPHIDQFLHFLDQRSREDE